MARQEAELDLITYVVGQQEQLERMVDRLDITAIQRSRSMLEAILMRGIAIGVQHFLQRTSLASMVNDVSSVRTELILRLNPEAGEKGVLYSRSDGRYGIMYPEPIPSTRIEEDKQP